MKTLVDLGFDVVATRGTADTLERLGVKAAVVNKVYEGKPDTADLVDSGRVVMVVNTVDTDPKSIEDSKSLRRAALLAGVPYCTTLAAFRASADAIEAMRSESIGVRSIQQIHESM